MNDPENLSYRIVPVTAFEQNCSLVWDRHSREAVAIDPGGDIERLLTAIEEEALKLCAIWLTHGHIDHAAGAPALSRAVGSVPIVGPHRGDAFWLQGLPQQAQMFGFSHAEAFTPDQWLEDGESVTVGSLRFEVRHVPGHTPGHVVFYQPEARLAFVGDVLFAGSIGRTDFPGGDHAALIHGIRHKLFPLGDDVRFVSGHGPMSTFGEERRYNPFVGEGR